MTNISWVASIQLKNTRNEAPSGLLGNGFWGMAFISGEQGNIGLKMTGTKAILENREHRKSHLWEGFVNLKIYVLIDPWMFFVVTFLYGLFWTLCHNLRPQ